MFFVFPFSVFYENTGQDSGLSHPDKKISKQQRNESMKV
jgi:hypothetical protein